MLHLHLKRFEYDVHLDKTVKINDRFEFPIELNLNKYLHEDVKDEDLGLETGLKPKMSKHAAPKWSPNVDDFLEDLDKSIFIDEYPGVFQFYEEPY